MPEATDIAWAAGLFEGEGSISLRRLRDGSAAQATVSIDMTDPDVIIQLAARLGIGRLHGPYKGTNKPRYRWTVSRLADVETFCTWVYPFLGERRQARIRQVLGEMKVYAAGQFPDRVPNVSDLDARRTKGA